MTVLAVADGAKQPRQPVLEKLHDKVSGIGLVRFEKPKRQITVECWPLLADVTAANSQFRGWPQTFDVLANYARQALAHLPMLTVNSDANPVLEIIEESTGELVMALRLATRSFAPGVFSKGKYTVRLSLPETGKVKELTGLEASVENAAKLEITL